MDGCRVLDLTGPIGQYCGRLLADLGADVVKVEPPAGDAARRLAPFAGDQPGPERSLHFLNFNTNKRSAVLDLERPDGRAALLELVAGADVVLESFSPGTLDRLGLGYAALREANPGIVLTSITPFGQRGPYRDFKANDMIGVAMGGMMYINGEPHRPPCTSPLEQAYQMAGLHAAFGTLVALYERRRSGLGQHLDVSMQEVQAHMFFNVAVYSAIGDIALRLGERSSIVPNSIYRTKDGHVSMSLFQPRQWPALAAWMANPILADPGWEDRELRRENGELIDTCIAELTARYSTCECVAEGQRRRLPVGPVQSVAEFTARPHVIEREIFVELEHPVLGPYRLPRPSFRSSASGPSIRRPAPLLGQHSEQVWREWTGARPVERGNEQGTGARRLPLAGVRVVDFTRVWAGPFGTRLLADYGADVIRVESRKFPDSRGAAHMPEAVRRHRDAHFTEMHRNKRSVTLDLHLAAGRDLARRLVATADIVAENYGPGVMERFGLGYQDLAAVRPEIIMLSMPGLGRSGPDSEMLAYGQQLMAYLGLSALWRQPQSPLAACTKLAYPDFIAAGHTALAAVAALHERARSGRGRFVELAQIEATAGMMGVAFLDYFINGRVAAPQGNVDANFAPHAAYRCAGDDRWIAIACETDEEWRAFCAVVDDAALAADPRFATKALRHEHRAALDPLVEAWTRTRSPHQAMYLLQRAGVPAGVVASAEDLYHDIHMRARGYLLTIDHPDTGPLDHPGMTVHLSDTPGHVRRPAPSMGEHNEELLIELLGLSPQEYQWLVAQGVIV